MQHSSLVTKVYILVKMSERSKCVRYWDHRVQTAHLAKFLAIRIWENVIIIILFFFYI